jgi:hypothetical protein
VTALTTATLVRVGRERPSRWTDGIDPSRTGRPPLEFNPSPHACHGRRHRKDSCASPRSVQDSRRVGEQARRTLPLRGCYRV